MVVTFMEMTLGKSDADWQDCIGGNSAAFDGAQRWQLTLLVNDKWTRWCRSRDSDEEERA